MRIFRILWAAITGRPSARAPIPAPEAQLVERRRATNLISIDQWAAPREILFVESSPFLLEQLEACVADLGSAWSCRIAASGDDGLKWLTESRFDGVVAAVSLSDMGGFEFLRRAAEVAPATVGILRVGAEDRLRFARRGGLLPHFLPRTCTANELADSLQRIFQEVYGFSGNDDAAKAA